MSSTDFTFEQLFAIAETFFDTLVGFDDFFFSVHTYYLPTPSTGMNPDFLPFTGSLVAILLGSGLAAFLTFRLVKYLTDIIF